LIGDALIDRRHRLLQVVHQVAMAPPRPRAGSDAFL
jgi:hypothetical protein